MTQKSAAAVGTAPPRFVGRRSAVGPTRRIAPTTTASASPEVHRAKPVQQASEERRSEGCEWAEPAVGRTEAPKERASLK